MRCESEYGFVSNAFVNDSDEFALITSESSRSIGKVNPFARHRKHVYLVLDEADLVLGFFQQGFQGIDAESRRWDLRRSCDRLQVNRVCAPGAAVR